MTICSPHTSHVPADVIAAGTLLTDRIKLITDSAPCVRDTVALYINCWFRDIINSQSA